MEKLTGDFEKDAAAFDKLVGFGSCFDLKKRPIEVGGKKGYFWYASSLANDLLIEQMLSHYLLLKGELPDSAEMFRTSAVPAGDVTLVEDLSAGADEVLSGNSALMIEGMDRMIVTDTKSVPSRGVGEPESDKVLRGSRDGFVENLIENVAILRRRLCVQGLRIQKFSVGNRAKSNVALLSIDGLADDQYVKKLADKLSSIQTDSLTMGQESLAECLLHKAWYNPFPKFRYTERPDAVSAMLLEGSVAILCDNSPQAMILPTAIFDFLQESDDFYFPPLVGGYLRILRMTVFLIALLLTPTWYLLTMHPEWVPKVFSFILIEDRGYLPILVQLLLVEFTIDGLKLASMNTPDVLSGSLSIVAGLIIGDFAIEVGWLVPEVILYMAFAAMANFTQPSYELGYAFKFMRILLLILTALFDWVGFVAGLILIVLFISLNKTPDGSRSYLYPLIPWNGRALLRQFIRVSKKNSQKP
ncbi:MAG: spore germination protein [Eubacteriales bacterium]